NDAIESAENQTMAAQDYELIVQHDDLSTSANLNAGIERCNGDYIKLLADDDSLTPNSIEDLYNYAVDGDYDVVYANAVNFNDVETVEYRPNWFRTISHLADENPIHGGTTLYKKQALIDVGGFNESLNWGEEFELHLRMADAGKKFGYLNEFVYFYRMHDKQKSAGAYGGGTQGKDYLLKRFKCIEDIRRGYRNNLKRVNR
ncbi:MAG: glycosyltransferase family 2 protein, partial [Nitrosomonadaceae bacterium]